MCVVKDRQTVKLYCSTVKIFVAQRSTNTSALVLLVLLLVIKTFTDEREREREIRPLSTTKSAVVLRLLGRGV